MVADNRLPRTAGASIRSVRARSFGSGADAFRNRSGGGGIFVVADETLVSDLLRRANGTFLSTEAAKGRYYAESIKLQRYIVEELDKSILRKRASSGKLRRAMMDPRNRIQNVKTGGGAFGFAVGNVPFLDSSEAKYWRQIESGYAGHVGRELNGVFGTGPDIEGRQPAGPYSYFDPSKNQGNFAPGRAAMARARAAGTPVNSSGTRARRGVIDVPIREHRYLSKAWKRYRDNDLKALVRAHKKRAGEIR